MTIDRTHVLGLLALAGFVVAADGVAQANAGAEQESQSYDVVVYGGTAGGVAAAVQAAHMGKSVVLVEPSRHIGGLTSGGLGATDIGSKAAIGGLSRSFYRRVGDYYARGEAWVHERSDDYRSRRQRSGEREMWTFEPHVAEAILRQTLKEAGVRVLTGERLDLEGGVQKSGSRITAIVTESGLRLNGKMYIDAGYEGDLMAKAGVSYHVGRESTDTYGESLNGVQTRNAIYHQFIVPVDPYVVPGDPSSGLLPGIQPDRRNENGGRPQDSQPNQEQTPVAASEPNRVSRGPGEEGSGDHRVQAYCFRMCTTDVADNQVPWKKPDDYDPLRYELLLRNFEAGDHRVPWNPILMPNRKTDTNNNYAISTDNIGMSYDYPDANYERREAIVREHLSYQQGLMWTLAHNPRVPESIRREFQTWRPAKDEFVDSEHWPHQLYIREARRMVSGYVMTQHDCLGRRVAEDSVGLAAYTMDSHNVQRYVKDGRVLNEGDVQAGGFSPYPIAYRSICPKRTECSNLLVPVCLSASHIAFGSIRMEPVFMVLGQSAAAAASLAIDAGCAVQDVEYRLLRERLLADGQVLSWTGPKREPPIDPAELPGIVVDDRDAELSGTWTPSKSVGPFVGIAYLHDRNAHKGRLRAVFRPRITSAGRYTVRIAYTAHPNRAANVPVIVESVEGTRTLQLNQKKSPGPTGFQTLGVFEFAAGTSGSVTISNEQTDGHVIVDAVQFVSSDEP